MLSWPHALRVLTFCHSFAIWILFVYLKLKLCVAILLLFSSTIARMLGCELKSLPSNVLVCLDHH